LGSCIIGYDNAIHKNWTKFLQVTKWAKIYEEASQIVLRVRWLQTEQDEEVKDCEMNISFKPKRAFHIPNENKKLAAETRRRPIARGMPRLKINKGLGSVPRLKF
jgi:hypothetical protein